VTAQLRWSARARADLRAIHDLIAKDAPLTAKAIAREIMSRAIELIETPRLGRVVAELADRDIREIPVPSWRLVYRLRGDDLVILTLVHKRPSPAPERLRG
jgi:toxin ParE1/3/4